MKALRPLLAVLWLAACAGPPEVDPRYPPAESILEVLAVLQRHVPVEEINPVLAPPRKVHGQVYADIRVEGSPKDPTVRLTALTERLELDLPGGVLAGRVVHADDRRPASGVVLTLSSPDDDANGLDRADIGEGTLLTDAEGEFRFDGDMWLYVAAARE